MSDRATQEAVDSYHCRTCDGEGLRNNEEGDPCGVCGGLGYIEEPLKVSTVNTSVRRLNMALFRNEETTLEADPQLCSVVCDHWSVLVSNKKTTPLQAKQAAACFLSGVSIAVRVYTGDSDETDEMEFLSNLALEVLQA